MKLDVAPLNLFNLSPSQSHSEVQEDNNYPATEFIEVSSPLVEDKQALPQTPAIVFATTFVTIFLAEIGDKTQLSTLLMSAQSQSPWVVFLGSAVALVTTSLLGVVLGSWIASRLSPKTVEKAAGIMLLFISLTLFLDILQS